MKSPAFPRSVLRALVLGCLILLITGCSSLSKAKLGISGTDETKPLTGPRSQ